MTTKQEYIDALECITKEYYSTVRFPEECNKFNSYLRLFKGLVNEHFEEKQETNYEHYKDKILEDSGLTLALVGGKLYKCISVHCSDCEFSTGHGCNEKLKEWLRKPYEKPTYKLTQFEFDLLNAHKDSGMQKCISNYRPLLEMYGKGHFKGIDTSTPIREILDNCKVV